MAAARTNASTAPLAIEAAAPVTIGSRVVTPVMSVKEPRSAIRVRPCRTRSIWLSTLPVKALR